MAETLIILSVMRNGPNLFLSALTADIVSFSLSKIDSSQWTSFNNCEIVLSPFSTRMSRRSGCFSRQMILGVLGRDKN